MDISGNKVYPGIWGCHRVANIFKHLRGSVEILITKNALCLPGLIMSTVIINVRKMFKNIMLPKIDHVLYLLNSATRSQGTVVQ